MSQGKWLKQKVLGCGNLKYVTRLTYKEDLLEDPYFNGKDICAVLGYSDPTKAMWEILNEDEKSNVKGDYQFSNHLQRGKSRSYFRIRPL